MKISSLLAASRSYRGSRWWSFKFGNFQTCKRQLVQAIYFRCCFVGLLLSCLHATRLKDHVYLTQVRLICFNRFCLGYPSARSFAEIRWRFAEALLKQDQS